jgi:ribulose-phosphate 3-epimerase
MERKGVQIAPSILSADFSRLGEEVKKVEEGGADLLHCDIMDGHFVPNLTMGPMVLEGVKRWSSLPLDIHLMVENNPFFVDLFLPLRPRFISFHWESEPHPHRLVQKIKGAGVGAAIALNPATPVEVLEDILPELEMVLIMSVNPGFGGQKFLPLVYDKIARLRKMAQRKNPDLLIEVDGGVNSSNAPKLVETGVDILVAGSYIFKSPNYSEAIASLRPAEGKRERS